MTSYTEDVRVDLARALIDRLRTVNWDHVSWSEECPEAMADRMFASLPTVFINDPAVGACFTTRGLVMWRGSTRQAIYQERRSGRLLGFLHGKKIVYPALQFSNTGRPLLELRTLLAKLRMPPENADQAANWLDTVDPTSEESPRALLTAASIRQRDSNRTPELGQVRIIREKLKPERLTTELR
ncbi:hypothetical protein [Frigoribacterium sp. UYMn621]|uniref:hypothetical protein n=1 Tax=Frigoribacterium sp. UYMn621 TaxID=3156343 RepID=UPI003391EFBD